MLENIEKIHAKYKSLAKKYGTSNERFPYEFNKTPNNSGEYLEIASMNTIDLVRIDRDKERNRINFGNTDELLYYIFKSFALLDASEYEFQNRENNRDSRRISYPKAIELIAQISHEWRDRLEKELDERLAVYPYNDNPD